MTSDVMVQENLALPLKLTKKTFLILQKDVEATCADGEN